MNNTYYTYERVMTHAVFKIGNVRRDVTDDVRLSMPFRVLPRKDVPFGGIADIDLVDG